MATQLLAANQKPPGKIALALNGLVSPGSHGLRMSYAQKLKSLADSLPDGKQKTKATRRLVKCLDHAISPGSYVSLLDKKEEAQLHNEQAIALRGIKSFKEAGEAYLQEASKWEQVAAFECEEAKRVINGALTSYVPVSEIQWVIRDLEKRIAFIENQMAAYENAASMFENSSGKDSAEKVRKMIPLAIESKALLKRRISAMERLLY